MTDRLVPSKKEGQDLIESWEGGGGTPLFKPYRYMPPQRVGFLGLFGLKKYTLPILVWNQVYTTFIMADPARNLVRAV